jgi:hypothetical protein
MTETELIMQRLEDVRTAISERIGAHETLSAQRHEYLDHLLRGNGTPGIITRLDRIERDAAKLGAILKWAIGIGTTVCVTLAIKAFQ